MTPTELRALAEALRPMAAAPCFDGIDIDRAADYLHQQADQQSVGTLTISTFRGRAQNQNRDFDYTGGLPDGSYSLYTAPVPAAPQSVSAEPCVGNEPPSRGHAFTITEGAPTTSGATRWCCYCGKARKEKEDAANGTKAWKSPMTLRECMEAEEQAEPKREPHWIDPKFSEWWASDKADERADNPFQADSAAAWAYAGWRAAQRAEPKRPAIKVDVFPQRGYWGVELIVGTQAFVFDEVRSSPNRAEAYAERLRKALGIGDSDAE